MLNQRIKRTHKNLFNVVLFTFIQNIYCVSFKVQYLNFYKVFFIIYCVSFKVQYWNFYKVFFVITCEEFQLVEIVGWVGVGGITKQHLDTATSPAYSIIWLIIILQRNSIFYFYPNLPELGRGRRRG